jgi:amino acid permease
MAMADESRDLGNKVMSARLAQGLAGGLTAWALLVQLLHWHEASPFTFAFPLIALLVSLKQHAGHRERATACFTAALLVSSILIIRVLLVAFSVILRLLLGGIWRDRLTITLTLNEQLLLPAAVLSAFAGAFFWLAAKRTDDGGAEVAS